MSFCFLYITILLLLVYLQSSFVVVTSQLLRITQENCWPSLKRINQSWLQFIVEYFLRVAHVISIPITSQCLNACRSQNSIKDSKLSLLIRTPKGILLYLSFACSNGQLNMYHTPFSIHFVRQFKKYLPNLIKTHSIWQVK